VELSSFGNWGDREGYVFALAYRGIRGVVDGYSDVVCVVTIVGTVVVIIVIIFFIVITWSFAREDCVPVDGYICTAKHIIFRWNWTGGPRNDFIILRSV